MNGLVVLMSALLVVAISWAIWERSARKWTIAGWKSANASHLEQAACLRDEREEARTAASDRLDRLLAEERKVRQLRLDIEAINADRVCLQQAVEVAREGRDAAEAAATAKVQSEMAELRAENARLKGHTAERAARLQYAARQIEQKLRPHDWFVSVGVVDGTVEDPHFQELVIYINRRAIRYAFDSSVNGIPIRVEYMGSPVAATVAPQEVDSQ